MLAMTLIAMTLLLLLEPILTAHTKLALFGTSTLAAGTQGGVASDT